MKTLSRFAKVCLISLFLLPLSMSAQLVSAHALPIEDAAIENSIDAESRRLIDGIAAMPIVPDKTEDATLPAANALLSSTGTYPTRKGIILVTDYKVSGIVPTGHAAIVYSASKVVESVADGVVLGSNNWNTQYDNCAAAVVVGTTTSQDASVGNWCYSQIGKPYSWNYYNVNRRDAFYCAQLVWAGYKDVCGIDLNTSEAGTAIHPLELLWPPNTGKVYGKGNLA